MMGMAPTLTPGLTWILYGGETIPQKMQLTISIFWLAVVCIAVVEFLLCHEALVCRGYPPLTEVGIYKKWIAFCLFWIPAIFGDRAARLRGLIAIAIFTSIIFSMISINRMVVPSIGHLAGVTGILLHHLPEILVSTLFYSPVAFAIMYFPERVFGDLWRAIWGISANGPGILETWRFKLELCNYQPPETPP